MTFITHKYAYPHTRSMQYLVGTSGWNYSHWKTPFYNDAPSAEWLSRYKDVFNTVEVNNTFYRWPKREYLEKWSRTAGKDFKFTFKVPRTISHAKDPDLSQIKNFYDLTDGINMGCYLFQFPPSFKNDPAGNAKLDRFLDVIDPKKDNAIEFRNKSWWDDRIYRRLKEKNIAFVSVSGLEMPDDILATADFAYVRCHGKHYDTRYTQDELKMMADKIRRLDVDRVYVYFDNDQSAFAPMNAQEIRSILEVRDNSS